MLFKVNYSQTIIHHFLKALNTEIERQKKVWDRVGEQWPPWFDPNDIWIYESMRDWLNSLETENPPKEFLDSKPYQFMMNLIQQYVNQNIDTLSDSELNEIVTFYNDYLIKKQSITSVSSGLERGSGR